MLCWNDCASDWCVPSWYLRATGLDQSSQRTDKGSASNLSWDVCCVICCKYCVFCLFTFKLSCSPRYQLNCLGPLVWLVVHFGQRRLRSLDLVNLTKRRWMGFVIVFTNCSWSFRIGALARSDYWTVTLFIQIQLIGFDLQCESMCGVFAQATANKGSGQRWIWFQIRLRCQSHDRG